MRLLVCGSRHFADQAYLDHNIRKLNPTLIIEGEANGADKLAKEWAIRNNVPFLPFPANWIRYGRAAGPIRNTQMLKEGKPDVVLAFLAQNSRGTRDMIKQARKAKVKTIVLEID